MWVAAPQLRARAVASRIASSQQRQGVSGPEATVIRPPFAPPHVIVQVGHVRQDGVDTFARSPQVDPAARQHHPYAHLGRGAAHRVLVLVTRQLVVLDHRRRAAVQVLDEPEQRGQVLVLGRHRGLGRPDHFLEPAQQRPVVGQPAQERLREVGVRVDQAGQHGHVPGVDEPLGTSRATLGGAAPGPIAATLSPSSATQPTVSVSPGRTGREQRAVLDQDT